MDSYQGNDIETMWNQQKRFKSQVDDALLQLDKQTSELDCSPIACELYGYSCIPARAINCMVQSLEEAVCQRND